MEIYDSNLSRMTPEQLEQAGRLLLAVAEHGWPERFGEPWDVHVHTDAFEGGTVFLAAVEATAEDDPTVVMGQDGKPELLLACESCGKDTRLADLTMIQAWEVCPDCIEQTEKAVWG